MSDRRKKHCGGIAAGAERFIVSITDLNNLGYGVGRLPSESGTAGVGLVIFVRGAVTGDTVEVMIIKKTASYAVGRLLRVVEASPLRDAQEFCQAPEACGGCVFRHLSYQAELDSKLHRVEAAFRQAGLDQVTVLPVLSTGQTSGYRNKGMYPVKNGKHGMEAGFYAAKSHTLIPSAACALQPPLFAEVVQKICAFCDAHRIPAYDEITQEGVLRHIYLRISAPQEGTQAEGGLTSDEKNRQLMVCLVIRTPSLPGGEATSRALVDMLLKHFSPQLVSVQLNINSENTNVVLGDQFFTLWGTDYIQDELCGRQFRISAGSFYQVNHDAAALLYATAIKHAKLTGKENLWDLYCGIGTIGLSMLGRGQAGEQILQGAATVTGVEIVPEAVACAKQNAQLNASLGLIPENAAQFFCADAGASASMLAAVNRGEMPKPDIVVIDPPRKGTTPDLIRELDRHGIKRVLYISCNPETLARDCAIFCEHNYTVGTVQPVDMFPRTGHVECVVLMSRKDK